MTPDEMREKGRAGMDPDGSLESLELTLYEMTGELCERLDRIAAALERLEDPKSRLERAGVRGLR